MFKSTNNLFFEVAKWEHSPMFDRFRVGTCDGLYRCTQTHYEILGIHNKEKGNGHLQDVFDWFENSCKRDNLGLRVLEVGNETFKQHLINKRGFVQIDNDNVEKFFN